MDPEPWVSVEPRATLESDDVGVNLGRRDLPKGRMSPRLNEVEGEVGERMGEDGVEIVGARERGERSARLVVL